MKQVIIKNTIYIVSSIAISLFLLIAAIGKITHPNPLWPDIDFTVAIFEILFSFGLIAFHLHWEAWVFAAIVFASWSGYSLFWTLWGISCSCFGQMINFPPGFTLLIDVVFVFYTLSIAYLLGAKRIKFILVFLAFMAVLGFFMAQHLHTIYF